MNTEFEGRAFSDDEKAEWNKINAERDEITATITEIEKRHARIQEIVETHPESVERGATFHTKRPESIRDEDIYDLSAYRSRAVSIEQEDVLLRDGAKRAIDQATFEHDGVSREDAQAHVLKLVEKHCRHDSMLARRLLVTGSPTYKEGFAKAAAGLPLTNDEARALSLTGASGGFAVPFTLDPTIIPTSNGQVNPLRQISRVETVTTNEWKGVTSAGVTASYVAEGTEASDNSPTLAQPDFNCERAQAFVPYSIEIGGDWSAVLSEIASAVSDAKDAVESTKFTTGAGHASNEPQGVITGATGTVVAGTAAFAVAHLYALKEALPPRFRPNGSFLASDVILDDVRQFDTSGGADLWVQLRDDTPPILLGKPTYENSAMATVLTAGSKIMVYGDFRYFLIVDRLGMTMELIPHVFGASGRPTGQRGAYTYWRNTSGVLSASAFKVLQTT